MTTSQLMETNPDYEIEKDDEKKSNTSSIFHYDHF